jgi:hypothetical protein
MGRLLLAILAAAAFVTVFGNLFTTVLRRGPQYVQDQMQCSAPRVAVRNQNGVLNCCIVNQPVIDPNQGPQCIPVER